MTPLVQAPRLSSSWIREPGAAPGAIALGEFDIESGGDCFGGESMQVLLGNIAWLAGP